MRSLIERSDMEKTLRRDISEKVGTSMSSSLPYPNPVLDNHEIDCLDDLEKRYNKLIEPNSLKKLSSKATDILPDRIKDAGVKVKDAVSEQDFIKQALNYAAEGFKILEELAANMTISEKTVLKLANKTITQGEITSLDEICFARAYDLSKIVNKYKKSDTIIAAVEGASTGALGFVGLIPNFVTSTFLYFRAVQSVAMFYGYDVKNDAKEMEIASAVMMNSISPGKDVGNNGLTAAVGKFMVFTETTAVRQASKKTWAEMINRGGLSLIIAQIRALSNKAAKNALEKAGQKGLEQSVFKSILEQLGKKASLKSTGRAMPVVGGVFGALFDTAQMSKVISYADIFYSKRFIEEKEVRINTICNPDDVVDVEDYDIITD